MLIKNANILCGDTRRFTDTTMTVKDGRIAAFGEQSDDEVFDAKGLFVLPGMIDTHIHGFVGVEFASRDEGFEKAQQVLAADGVTGFAATIRCLPFEEMLAAEKNAVRCMREPSVGAKVLGIHSEGPFVSTVRRGAMYPPDITCTVEAVAEMIDAGEGALKLMTIAPERENAADVIAFAATKGLTCTMGHTDATFLEATAAIDAGASRATHIFNAMRPLYHRETGILGAALTDDRVCCELIADFVHLDPAAVKLVYRAKGADRITLISDAGAHSGLPNGDYVIGGKTRHVKDGVCRNDAGAIAGSCFSMLKGAQNLVSLGVPLEEVAVMASLNPAKALGVDDTTGSLDIGKAADFIVCDDQLHIHAVFIDGQRVV